MDGWFRRLQHHCDVRPSPSSVEHTTCPSPKRFPYRLYDSVHFQGKTIMAGAGSSWYAPLLVPFANIATASSLTGKEKIPTPQAISLMSLTDNLTSFAGAFRSFALAYACIHAVGDYPAFGRATALEFAWMWPILLRNIVATWIICGGWDYFLYFSPLKEKMRPYKLNTTYPSRSQLVHDAFWTTVSSICAAGVEILLCHGWATGKLPAIPHEFEWNATNIIAVLTITHWRIPHFYCMHRAMHPWKTTSVPDIGKFLYRHVHSLHHKSYNPTAFSGTSMHPVESTLYYSACLLAVPFGLHPAIVLGCIIDCGVGAWLGHDGFQWPGSGDYFHQLHHQHFDCNYGATHVPLDYLMGTFISRKEDLKIVWGNKKVGMAHNETKVHEAGVKVASATKQRKKTPKKRSSTPSKNRTPGK